MYHRFKKDCLKPSRGRPQLRIFLGPIDKAIFDFLCKPSGSVVCQQGQSFVRFSMNISGIPATAVIFTKTKKN